MEAPVGRTTRVELSMKRRPPRTRESSSSAATDVYKRQGGDDVLPWKRKGSAKKNVDPFENASVADSPANVHSNATVEEEEESMSPPVYEGCNNTNDLQKTFKGERGGVDDDEDLLAEHTTISMKNKRAERFGNEK